MINYHPSTTDGAYTAVVCVKYKKEQRKIFKTAISMSQTDRQIYVFFIAHYTLFYIKKYKYKKVLW